MSVGADFIYAYGCFYRARQSLWKILYSVKLSTINVLRCSIFYCLKKWLSGEILITTILSPEDTTEAGSTYCFRGGKRTAPFYTPLNLFTTSPASHFCNTVNLPFRGLWGLAQYKIQSQVFGLSVRWIDHDTEPCFCFFFLMDKIYPSVPKYAEWFVSARTSSLNDSALKYTGTLNKDLYYLSSYKVCSAVCDHTSLPHCPAPPCLCCPSILMFLSSQMETIRLLLLQWMRRRNLVQFQKYK